MQKMLLAVLTISAAYGAACDRACLRTSLDQYMNAVLKHDPASAPLSLGFRQPENAVARPVGTGLWQSAKALGKLQRRYFDAVTEQAGFFGLLEEEKGPAIVTLRLRVEDRKITEAEWVISRAGDPGIGPDAGNQAEAAFYNPQYLLDHAPPMERVIPRAERISRTDLIAVTNSYFDGLSGHDGKLIIAHAGCVRIENGVVTTQRPIEGGGQTDCTHEGAMRNIFAVTARRYPLVDEEAGVVLGIVIFQRKPGVVMRRNLLSEWFYIEKGKIQSIYASMYYPDQEALAPNWPPFDGNWAVPVPPR